MKMEEQTYKYSKYNIELETENEDEVTIFNTYTSKYVTLDKEVVEDLKCETDISLGDFPDYLIDLGIFVPSDLNEFDRVKKEHYAIADKQASLSFLIAATSNCNYDCCYCFEGRHKGNKASMSVKTQDATVNFIKTECIKNNTKEVKFDLFGGEPLLVPDIFEHIICELKPFFESHNIKYFAHIVTNGFYLSKEMVNKLKNSCNLRSAQITLDGLESTYNRLKNPQSTDAFYRVIDNIKEVQDEIAVSVRLNVTEANAQEMKELIDYLTLLKLHVQIYYSNVFDLNDSAEKYTSVFNTYCNNEEELSCFVEERGYKEWFHQNYVSKRKICACGSNNPNFYAIDSEGYLYKCWENVFNKDYRIGSVYDGITNKELNDFYLSNPLKIGCSDCSYMPVCQGKCPIETILQPYSDVCASQRALLHRHLKRYVLNASKA